MKKRSALRRQIFVLTPEEKKAVTCVLAALVLGIVTRQYRTTHPLPAPVPTAKEQQAIKRAEKATAARARSARGKAAAGVARSSTASPADDDDQD
jgi:hypothetical protein